MSARKQTTLKYAVWYSAHRPSSCSGSSIFFFFVAHQRDLISYFDYLRTYEKLENNVFFHIRHDVDAVYIFWNDDCWSQIRIEKKTLTTQQPNTDEEVVTEKWYFFNIPWRCESFVMSLNAKHFLSHSALCNSLAFEIENNIFRRRVLIPRILGVFSLQLSLVIQQQFSFSSPHTLSLGVGRCFVVHRAHTEKSENRYENEHMSNDIVY